MSVTFLQTADPYLYAEMLEHTAKTVKEFCRRRGYKYESYLGIKRGEWPWQATYNRIVQLKELLDRDYRGWCIYLDADAYIVDLEFDLTDYLRDKNDRAAILMSAMASSEPWDINIGVGLFNLGNDAGRKLVWDWHNRFAAIPLSRLAESKDWLEYDNDQDLIQQLFRENPGVMDSIHIESTDLMNSNHATFIRQRLRSDGETYDDRLEAIANAVAVVLNDDGSSSQAAGACSSESAGAIVDAVYNVVLGREPDAEGGRSAIEGVMANGLGLGLRMLLAQVMASAEFKDLTSK